MFFPESGFLRLYHEQRIHQSETLYFTVRASDPKARQLKEDLELEFGGRRFWIAEMVKGRIDAEATVEVEAPAIWTKLADWKHIGTLTFVADALDDVLAFVIDRVPGWTHQIVSPANPAKPVSLEANDASVLDIVRKIAKLTGYEVDFDTTNKIVRLVDELGADRGLGFTYGHNLTEVERRSNPPEVTRLWAFGKSRLGIGAVHPGGLPYVEDLSFYTAQGLTETEARERYTKEEIYSDESFIHAQDLYDAAVERLAELSQATVNYTMGVLDLSSITASASDDYDVGDTVLVTDDELHFTNVRARVVRVVKHPLAPWNSEIELAYLPVVAPDPDVSGARGDTAREWELYASRNTATERYVGAVRTVLHRLVLNTVTGAEWVVGFMIDGTVTASGILEIEVFDDTTDERLVPLIELDVTVGDPIRHTFSFGDNAVAPGQYNLVARARGLSGAELTIPEGATSLWVLARGTTQQTLTLTDSIRFDYTGAIQTFEVPDDVSEITIECNGSVGGYDTSNTPAGGGRMTAKFQVLPGQMYDIYVGGPPAPLDSAPGGWPDGGDGDTISGANAFGGGGSSRVIPQGLGLVDALIVAGGGGGAGEPDAGAGPLDHKQNAGGGGWPTGEPGVDSAVSGNLGGLFPGQGGTQTAGGAGGTGVGVTDPGDAGTFGQGGNAGDATSAFTFPPGGGGGGWYGGGGGGTNNVSGSGNGGGGGGGSGYLGDGGSDLDVANAVNTEDGYVIISWENPVT